MNNDDDYLKGYKAGLQAALDYIKWICFSKDGPVVEYRCDYGSHGVRDSIIRYLEFKLGADAGSEAS